MTIVTSLVSTMSYVVPIIIAGNRTNPMVQGRIQVGVDHTAMDSFLEFDVLEMSDSGTYVCVVSNSAGTRENSIVLEVEGMCTV